MKITVLTLVSGNKWRCSQSGVCKQEQVIAYNKCPGIAILPGLVCPFSFSLPPLKILRDLFYFISCPCTLYCYWSVTPGNWSPSLPGRKKQNSFRIFILFLISLQYKSSDYLFKHRLRVLLSGSVKIWSVLGMPDVQWETLKKGWRLPKNPSHVRHCIRHLSLHYPLSWYIHNKQEIPNYRVLN